MLHMFACKHTGLFGPSKTPVFLHSNVAVCAFLARLNVLLTAAVTHSSEIKGIDLTI